MKLLRTPSKYNKGSQLFRYFPTDNPYTWARHVFRDIYRMWPRIRVYGIRYLTDYEYRVTCRKLIIGRHSRKKYGNNFGKKRPRFIRALTMRDGMGCNNCHIVNRKLTIDHVVPLSAGGANTLENMQLLCEKCHKAKSKEEAKHLIIPKQARV